MRLKHGIAGVIFLLLIQVCFAKESWDKITEYALLEQLQPFQFEETDALAQYSVIDVNHYHAITRQSRQKINTILKQLRPYRHLSLDQQIKKIVSLLIDSPYLFEHAMGEGDWQPNEGRYHGGALHIKQQPVYRLDAFDCQTFVQVVMSLLYANTLDEFDHTFLKIAYGAAGNPEGNIVRYYNRNHFIDADFNPINERHGYLTNLMHDPVLMPLTKRIKATITRNHWFKSQLQNMPYFVQVFSKEDGMRMVLRANQVYKSLPFARFDKEQIEVDYIPKEKFLVQQNGFLIPNQNLFDQIPTPAILEVVRDSSRWFAGRKKVKQIIGSDLTISHMGFLYKQAFKANEIIYQKITCDKPEASLSCRVVPMVCQQKICHLLMFAHATSNYPKPFSWFKQKNGKYHCEFNVEKGLRPCNRVTAIPFFAYLTDFQQGYRWMDNPSFLGFHIEKLNKARTQILLQK